MTTDLLAILALVILALSGFAANLLTAGLAKQLRLHREAIETAFKGLGEIHVYLCQIHADIKIIKTAVAANAADIKRIRIAIGDLTPDPPKSLGLSPTPVKLTPPAHDPEEEARKPRRRRHHARTRQSEAVK